MTAGVALTKRDLKRIHELRYLDGLTCREVAAIVGCHPKTVWHYAPGWPGKVPVAPLRKAFLASPRTAADVARELGWWASGDADSSRVKRVLGLLPETSSRGIRSWRTRADAETVSRIAEIIGVSPWAVLPEDDA